MVSEKEGMHTHHTHHQHTHHMHTHHMHTHHTHTTSTHTTSTHTTSTHTTRTHTTVCSSSNAHKTIHPSIRMYVHASSGVSVNVCSSKAHTHAQLTAPYHTVHHTQAHTHKREREEGRKGRRVCSAVLQCRRERHAWFCKPLPLQDVASCC